jgi:8-oxo-dGTP diphosphatase
LTEQERFRSAAVFLVNGQGELLLRLRDDRPDILHPNCWDVIGGLLEPGETPEEALLRETREEIGLDLQDFGFWRVHEGRITTFYLFHAPLAEPAESLLLTEGQEVRFLAPDDVQQLPLVPWMKDALPAFLASPAYASYQLRGNGQH